MSEEKVVALLASIYEEVMWLADRPNNTAADARAWYTHIAHLKVRRLARRFTGNVSRSAVTDEAAELRLEHFKRMQTTLTKLVARHLSEGKQNSEEFIETVLDCEQVHIVTKRENYDAMKAKGDYTLAGIELVPWERIPLERQQKLWKSVLRGRVANASDFAPCGANVRLAVPPDVPPLRLRRSSRAVGDSGR